MSTILERLQYGFDRDSRRTWRKRTLATNEDNAYGYDGLSQVVNAARGTLNLNTTAIGGVPAEAQAWDYDPTGNWRGYETKVGGSVALDQLRVHDKGNRLTQIEGAPNPVLLDRAGRMREVAPDAGGNWNESQQVKWDAWSRVVEVRRQSDGAVLGSYTYDGLTRRLTQSVGSTTTHTYYSDAWRPLEERRDSQTTAARHYYWGARHRDDLVRRDRATTSGAALNEVRYVLMDYFSPAAITDAAGTVTERYSFSAFGVRRILTPAFTDRATSECDFTFGFQGQFFDSESGFFNFGYRYYSPHLGRWLCKDPIPSFSRDTALYAFAWNDALNNTDIYGLACWHESDDKPFYQSGERWKVTKWEPKHGGGTAENAVTGFSATYEADVCVICICKSKRARNCGTRAAEVTQDLENLDVKIDYSKLPTPLGMNTGDWEELLKLVVNEHNKFLGISKSDLMDIARQIKAAAPQEPGAGEWKGGSPCEKLSGIGN